MEKSRYELLKDIKIEKSGIIKPHISDPVYKFCVINGIDNLGDFIEMYNVKRYQMDGRHNFYYFDGIIDFINLVFFDEKLPEGKNLCRKIKIFKCDKTFNNYKYAYVENDAGCQIGRSENASLRRLGFNNNETKTILGHVLYLDKEVSVIVAIKSCLENFNFKNMTNDDEMFITKLHILNEYYEKNKDDLGKVHSYDFYKAKENISELKNLYREMYKIQKKIRELSLDFEQKIEQLPKNDECVKRLIKTYEDFNCKED